MSVRESKLPSGLPTPETVRKAIQALREDMREGFGASWLREPLSNLFYNKDLPIETADAFAAVLEHYASEQSECDVQYCARDRKDADCIDGIYCKCRCHPAKQAKGERPTVPQLSDFLDSWFDNHTIYDTEELAQAIERYLWGTDE